MDQVGQTEGCHHHPNLPPCLESQGPVRQNEMRTLPPGKPTNLLHHTGSC